jgi:hypothetical protein
MSVAAGAFSMIVFATPGHGGTDQVVAAADPVAANRPQVAAPINAETMSCAELKDRLRSAGTLTVLSEQRSWSDTLYGPEVPQCQFWTRPMYEYVRTNDGACGAGYICAERTTGGR